MKKLVAALVVLAMILAMVPAVFAADEMEITGSVTDSFTGTFTATSDGNLTLNVNSVDDGYGYKFDVWNVTADELVDTIVSNEVGPQAIALTAGNVYEITVEYVHYWNSSLYMSASGTVDCTLTYSGTGTLASDGGDEITADVMIPAGSQYSNEYTWTATEAGTVTISVTDLQSYDAYSGEWQTVPEASVSSQFMRGFVNLVVNGETQTSDTCTLEVAANDTVTVSLFSYMGSQYAANIVCTLESAAGGEAESTALVIGNNNIEAANVTYVYTAEADGTLNLALGAAIMGPVEAKVYVSGNEAEAVALYTDSNVDLVLKAGETAVIEVTAEGYATLTASLGDGSGESGGEGEEDEEPEAVNLNGPFDYSQEIPGQGVVYFNGYGCDGYILTIEDTDAYVIYNNETVGPVNGKIELLVEADGWFSPVSFAIGNNSEEAKTISFSFVEPPPSVGSEGLPAELVIGSENIAYDDGWGYYFTYTAPSAGTLTLNMDADKSVHGWSAVINLDSGVYGDTIYSSEDPEDYAETTSADMAAGDVATIIVGTYDWSPNEVYFTATWTASSEGGDEGDEGNEGGETGTDDCDVVLPGEIVTSDKEFLSSNDTDKEYFLLSWTAPADGILHVHMCESNPGWAYGIEGLTYQHNDTEATTDTYTVLAGTTYVITIKGYNCAEYCDGDSEVAWSLSFEAAEVEIPKEEYIIIDDIITEEGTYEIGMEYADVTIVTFAPSVEGIYTVTVNGQAVIGNYGGGSWYIYPSESVTHGSSLEWTCAEAPSVETDTILDENFTPIEIERLTDGQGLMIGIKPDSEDVESVEITIEKTGEYVKEEIELQVYENKAELNQFDLGDLVVGDYVDVYGEDHTAVLGEDGYYHLDSADGPILLVDMDYLAVLTDALSSDGRGVMYAYVMDENGELTAKYDIADAVKAYESVCDENGYYPLNEDLLFFYQVYAVGNGVPQFVLEDGFNEQCAWMFACITAENPASEEGKPGDTALAAVIGLMTVSAMGITVIVSKKKEF